MSSDRLALLATPEARDELLVAKQAYPFRMVAWYEPVDDQSVDIHIGLMRSMPLASAKRPDGEVFTMNLNCVAASNVIRDVPASTPREQLVSLAEGHLNDLHEEGLREWRLGQEPALPIPQSASQRPAEMGGPAMG